MMRRSKRELEAAVEDLSVRDRPAGLITILSTATNDGVVELVDRDCRLVRVDGDLRRARRNALETMEGGWSAP